MTLASDALLGSSSEGSESDGHLDPELVRIFKDARIWEREGRTAP